MAEKNTAYKEEQTSFQAEVNARIPYLMGLNAKMQMRRDAFLTKFIPSITAESMSKAIPEEMLAKYGIRDLKEEEHPEDIFESMIYDDTRLLSKVAEASFETNYSEWSKEMETMNKVKAAAQAAFDIIVSCSENTARGNAKHSDEDRDRICSEINILDRDIAELADKIQKSYGTYMDSKDLTTEQKLTLSRNIKRFEKERWDYTIAKNARKAALIAEGCFNFSTELKEKQVTREQYIAGFIKTSEAYIENLKGEYLQKYGMVPPPILAYEEIIRQMPKLSREVNPELTHIRSIFETDIIHYTDLLAEGPNMILQISKMFPSMVQELDSEISLFRHKPEEYMNAFVQYIDEDDMHKGRNRFPFSMSNILGDRDTNPMGKESDLQVLAIYGPPGVGKTASVAGLMKKIGYNCLQISMPAADSSLFTGLPTINEKDQVLQTPSANLQPAVENPGLIVIDEATAPTDPGVAPQLARFLQLGEAAAGRKVHPLSTIVLMANDDIQHNPDIQPFSGIVQTRIKSVFRKDPNVLISGWVNWVMNNKGIQEDRTSKAAYDLILSFLLTTSEGRNYWIQKGSNEISGISPNFRTWSNLADEVGRIINNRGRSISAKADDLRRVANETVGPAAASELSKHYQIMANLPTIKELLERMDPKEGTQLSLKDAIRIFDMNNAQIEDTSKSHIVKKASAEDEKDEEGTKKKNLRFKLTVDPKEDESLVERLNASEKGNGTGYRKFTVKDLLPPKDLEKRYNEIWGDKNTDLTGTAVIFHFMNQISYQMQNVFSRARSAKTPVDGRDIDRLFKLAMTIPTKDPRQALIIKMMNSLLDPTNTLALYRHGIRYENEKKQDIVFRIVPETIKDEGGRIVKTDIEKLKAESSDPRTVFMKDAHVILPRRLIMDVSEAYKVNVEESKKRKPKEKAEAQKDAAVQPEAVEMGI